MQFAGLSTRLFRGIPTIHEVECSGHGLSSGVDLFALTLFTPEHVFHTHNNMRYTSNTPKNTLINTSKNAYDDTSDKQEDTPQHSDAQQNNSKLAYVNVNKKECVTSSTYSACFIDDANSRNSRIVTLIVGVEPGGFLKVGCNVTGFRAGEPHILSWSLVIRQPRKCDTAFMRGFQCWVSAVLLELFVCSVSCSCL
jgi:hypothetical protein